MNPTPLFSRCILFVAFATVWLGCSAQTPPISSFEKAESASSKVHYFDHVLTIVLENQDFDKANQNCYLKDLALRGASFNDFHGLYHPSYANYLAMVSGHLKRTFLDFQTTVKYPAVGEALLENHFTWKNYAEGYTGRSGHCVLESAVGRYARKHVPFLSFTQVQKESCKNVVPAGELAADLAAATLPSYAFYSPDLDHDGHDPTNDPAKGLSNASDWLKEFLEPLLKNPDFRRGTLVIVTFDESAGRIWGPGRDTENHIYTVFIGDMVKPNYSVTKRYNHLDILRTIEDNFGIEPLAEGDKNAHSISEVWN